MASERNIFAIGRDRRKEDQLTEMLVWLVSAVPDVGDVLCQMAFEPDSVGTSGVAVMTQYGVAGGRLDALFLGPSLVLVVESKIDSEYHDEQIGRYLDWIGATHGHRPNRALMTLTA